MQGFFGPLLLAAVLFIAPLSAVATGADALLRLAGSSFGRYVLLETEAGAEIAARVLGARLNPEADLAPFLRRLGEPELNAVSRELETDLIRIEARFRERFPGDAALGPAERRFLEEQAAELLRIEPRLFPAAPPAPAGFAASREAFLHPSAAGSLRAGRWQEAIWNLRESGQTALAEQADRALESQLRNGEIVERTPLGGGVTETYLLRFSDGTRAVFKPTQTHWASNPGHEIGAYRIDRLLNLNRVPMTIERTIDGRAGSVQVFMPDAVSGDVAHMSSPDRRINLLDYLLGHEDRHGANFLVLAHSGRRAVAIDHGLAFQLEEQPPYLLNPIRPDYDTYQRLLAMNREVLERELNGLVEPDRIRALLVRREYYMERVNSAISSQGEAAFFEMPGGRTKVVRLRVRPAPPREPAA